MSSHGITTPEERANHCPQITGNGRIKSDFLVAVGEAVHHRQAEGGGAPRWVQPTCGTSSGSSGKQQRLLEDPGASGGKRSLAARHHRTSSCPHPAPLPAALPRLPRHRGALRGCVQNGPCLEGDSTTKSYCFHKRGKPSRGDTSQGGLVAVPGEGGVSGIPAPG